MMKSFYNDFKNVIFTFGVISWVIFLIIPMPGFIIDLSISLMIGLSLVVFIQASTIDSWEDFRTFPLIMLTSTIFRIALNIATTRKIISGEDPGNVIEASGHFIVRDMVAIGFVMFVVLIIVQFIIAFGANRFGEVSARFALDALPGKQMSIDNDLNQGAIDPESAKKKKDKLQQEVDYYGSLDGAGKYIKGDVWAGITMILINMIVGIVVGMVKLDLSVTESINRFTMLSIGDGVINLICALMITVSGAVVLAKIEDNKQEDNQSKNEPYLRKIFRELVPNSKNLYIVGAVLIVLGIVGLPFFPMFIMGAAIITVGIVSQRNQKAYMEQREYEEQKKKEEDQNKNEKVEVHHTVEPLTVEVGYKLAPLFKNNTGKDIFGQKRENIQDKITLMRKIFANNLGVKIPKIKIRDNVTLHPSTKYVIKVKESMVASGNIPEGKILAIPSLLTMSEIEGEETKDPIYGQDALWINEDQLDEATDAGYDVWNPLNIVATHIHEVLEKNIWQFLSLQEVSDLIKSIGETQPILKQKMEQNDDYHLFQKVLVSLLKEKVSIKDLPTIIEVYLESYNQTRDIDTIVSLVRQRISRQICENYINQDGKLYMLSVEEEDNISVSNFEGNNQITMSFDWQKQFIERLNKEKENARAVDIDPVIVVRRPELRPALSKMIDGFEDDTPVVSGFELPLKIENSIIGTI